MTDYGLRGGKREGAGRKPNPGGPREKHSVYASDAEMEIIKKFLLASKRYYKKMKDEHGPITGFRIADKEVELYMSDGKTALTNLG